MNSFSNFKFKLAAFVLILSFANAASAIVITSIYTGGCNRKVGVTLGVGTYSLKFLTLDGKLETLPRHQVVQLVSYVTDEIPFTTQQMDAIANAEVTAFHVSTMKNLAAVPLVTGYPIDFTDEKIAFLTRSGREVLIDKRSVLHIQPEESFKLEPEPLKRGVPIFAHAYAFAQCETNRNSNAAIINPSQILSEPLTIKRELDRLQKGYALVNRYMEEQDFYPQPIVFPAQTRLGMWYSFGSRYGSSGSRTNNFAPVLNSGYVSDIYDFQRTIVTGSQPNLIFEHEEAQTQALYAFKASYFHLVAYMDPSLILVGKNAEWNAADLLADDVRLFAKTGLGFGFDYGKWQIGLLGSSVNLGLQSNNQFFADTVGLSKFHLTWSDYIQKAELITGSGSLDNFSGVASNYAELSHLRINYGRSLTDRLAAGLSYISNSAKMKVRTSQFEIKTKTDTVAFVTQYVFNKRFSVDSMLGIERLNVQSNPSTPDPKTFFKGGTSLHLFF